MNQIKTSEVEILFHGDKMLTTTIYAEAEYYVRMLVQLQYGDEIKSALSVKEVA